MPDQYPLMALCVKKGFTCAEKGDIECYTRCLRMIKTWWWGRLHVDQDAAHALHSHRRLPPRFSLRSHLSFDSLAALAPTSAAPPSSFSLRNNNSTLLCRRTESEERVSVVPLLLLLLLEPALNSSQPELLLTPAKLRSVNWVTLILAVFFAHLDHLRRGGGGGEVDCEVGREERRGHILVFLTLWRWNHRLFSLVPEIGGLNSPQIGNLMHWISDTILHRLRAQSTRPTVH